MVFSMGGAQIMKTSTNLSCSDALVPSTNPEEVRVLVLCGFEAQVFSFSLVQDVPLAHVALNESTKRELDDMI